MFRVAAALSAAIVIALVASAVRGQAQNVDGRFQLTAEDEGFLRLDTQTGALSLCQLSDGRWACAAVEIENATDFDRISDRISALEAALADLGVRFEEPDAAIRAQLSAIAAQLEALTEIVANGPDALVPETDPQLQVGIDALAAAQADLADAFETVARRDDFDVIAADLTALNERIGALETALVAALQSPEPKIPAVFEEDLAAIAELGGALGERFDQLAAADTEIVDRLSAMTVRIGGIEDRLAGITLADGEGAVALQEIRSLLELVVESQQAIDAGLLGVVTAIDVTDGAARADLVDGIAAIREWQTDANLQLAGMFEAIDRLSEAIAPQLIQAVAPLSERQAAIESQLAALALAIEEVAPMGAIISEAIIALEARQAAVEDGMATIAEEMAARGLQDAERVTEAFETLGREVVALRSEIVGMSDQLAAQIESLAARIDTVNARIDELPPPTDLAEKLARVEAELTALRDMIAPVESSAINGPEGPPANNAMPTVGEPEPLADEAATGFGEELFLRLEDMVRDLRQGLRGN